MHRSSDEHLSYRSSGEATDAEPTFTRRLASLLAVATLAVLIAGAVGATDIELPGPMSTAHEGLEDPDSCENCHDADFNVDRFSHIAVYDEDPGCIRMYLESDDDQVVHVAGEPVAFAAGEHVHTENSYKYDPGEFTRMAVEAGFEREAWWTDERERFAIFLLTA